MKKDYKSIIFWYDSNFISLCDKSIHHKDSKNKVEYSINSFNPSVRSTSRYNLKCYLLEAEE